MEWTSTWPGLPDRDDDGRLRVYGVRPEPQFVQGCAVFMLAAFLTTEVAGAFGAYLNKYAPIRGGATIHLMKAE
jgi:hypothetical protein